MVALLGLMVVVWFALQDDYIPYPSIDEVGAVVRSAACSLLSGLVLAGEGVWGADGAGHSSVKTGL